MYRINFPAIAPSAAHNFSVKTIEFKMAAVSVKRSIGKYHLEAASTLRTPNKFEHAALFLQFGLLSTLIPHENGAFLRKRCSNRRNLKMPALRFRADGKHLENGAFRKQKRHDYHVISLTWFPLHKSKMTGDCCVFKFPPPPPPGVVWTENI